MCIAERGSEKGSYFFWTQNESDSEGHSCGFAETESGSFLALLFSCDV